MSEEKVTVYLAAILYCAVNPTKLGGFRFFVQEEPESKTRKFDLQPIYVTVMKRTADTKEEAVAQIKRHLETTPWLNGILENIEELPLQAQRFVSPR